MKIAVLNSKGGASKSTVSLQVASAYFLNKGEEVTLYEFDDENKDSLTFNKSMIKTKQITVDNGDFLSSEITKIIANKESNAVFDVGGNKTTTLWIDALKKSRMYIGLNLIIISLSGGSQDVVNAKKVYDLLKDLNVPIIFALSRSRHDISRLSRVKYQYKNFFKEFPDMPYFILKDSDCIDLSRDIGKSVYEIANDKELKQVFENKIVEAFESGDHQGVEMAQDILSIVDESIEFNKKYLTPAFELIDNYNKE